MAKRGRRPMSEAERLRRAMEREASRTLPTLVWGKGDLRSCGIVHSDSQLWRLERAGRFPRRIRIGGRVGWVPEEIIAHVEAMKAARAA